MFQIQSSGRFSQLRRFVRIDRGRKPLAHRTETALPGTHLTEDQKSRGAHLPALVDVRAVGLLADGVKPSTTHQFSDFLQGTVLGNIDADPWRSGQWRFLALLK